MDHSLGAHDPQELRQAVGGDAGSLAAPPGAAAAVGRTLQRSRIVIEQPDTDAVHDQRFRRTLADPPQDRPQVRSLRLVAAGQFQERSGLALYTLGASVIGFLPQLASGNVVHDDLHRRRAFVIDPDALDIDPQNGTVESVDLGFPRFGASPLLQDLPRPGRDRFPI